MGEEGVVLLVNVSGRTGSARLHALEVIHQVFGVECARGPTLVRGFGGCSVFLRMIFKAAHHHVVVVV